MRILPNCLRAAIVPEKMFPEPKDWCVRVRACVRARVCARVRTRVCRTGQKDNGTSQRPPASSIVSLNSDKRPPSPSLSFSFSFFSSSSSSASLQGRDSRLGDSRSWFAAPLGRLPRIPSEHSGAHAAAACARCASWHAGRSWYTRRFLVAVAEWSTPSKVG